MRYLEGFDIVSAVFRIIKVPVYTLVTIAKGDALSASSGYAALATALDATFLGIAAHAVDNSAGASAAEDVFVIQPLAYYKFRVQVEAAAVITQAAVGAMYDLSTEDGITLADTSITANGFFVEDIDISAASIAANTFGHAIGHFRAIT